MMLLALTSRTDETLDDEPSAKSTTEDLDERSAFSSLPLELSDSGNGAVLQVAVNPDVLLVIASLSHSSASCC
jgi:hypothetical protein